MKIQFDTATEADIPAVFAQAKELIDTYEDSAAIEYDKVLDWVKRKITRHISQYRCAIIHGEKCAYWRLCDDGELDDVYVLPEFRGKGIGTQILQNCIREKGDLYLYVFTKNHRAISFYQRFGFQIAETVGETRCIMKRKG